MLAKRWTARLPDSYKAAVDPAAAADDIGRFERLFTGGEAFHVGLRNEPDGLTRIGMYRVGDKVELSQAMPTLEHLGLRVVEERPTRLLGGDGALWLQDFGVLGPTDQPLDLEECGERVAQCIAAVWRGEAESDSLNRLIINAGLDWRRIAILRAYRKYRQRIGSRFTESYQNDVIAANPHITAKLIRLFELRNDPAIERDEAAEAALHDDILEDLEAVPSLDHDRILRNQLGLIEATVRTNAYRHGPALDRLQAGLGRRARDPAAAAAVRDLRLRARGRGDPPARRARSPAAACAGRTAWTTAPRSSGSCARR